MPTIYFRGTNEQARQIIHSIPRILAGKVPDPTGLAKGVQFRGAVALLSQVQQDFTTKSRGGTGKDGIKWEPLKPATIAARTRSRADVTSFKAAKKANPKLTRLAYYGSRTVEILRDTSRLFRSLTPGVEDRPSGNPDQEITLTRGTLTLANKVPYFATHQNGTEHVPARPVFPVGGVIPPAYVPPVLGAMGRGVVVLLTMLLTGRRA